MATLGTSAPNTKGSEQNLYYTPFIYVEIPSIIPQSPPHNRITFDGGKDGQMGLRVTQFASWFDKGYCVQDASKITTSKPLCTLEMAYICYLGYVEIATVSLYITIFITACNVLPHLCHF